ncbi:MAG: DUF3098 domain-containing protein [Bacteroidetes bacterium]|nr:DUF3098 domain-containing protein [Bacteroidota bacterium]
MAKKIKRTAQQKKKIAPFSIPLGRQNFIIFAIGFIVICVGFFVMTTPPWDSTAALYISPILLGIGYFLIFPYGIFAKKKSFKSESISESK